MEDPEQTCEQCDGQFSDVAFCVPCWNKLGQQIIEGKQKLETAERRLKDEASAYKVLAEGYEAMKLQLSDIKSVLLAYASQAVAEVRGNPDRKVVIIPYHVHEEFNRLLKGWSEKRVEEKRSCGAKIEGGRCAFFWPCKEHCGDRNGGSVCVKTPGHGGCCEDEHHVWDWKPILGRQTDREF